MECMSCTSTKEMTVETITHKYKECGLDNITLEGVQKYKCQDCGEEHFNIKNVDELHRIIAEYLIKKEGTLLGKEVRFIRTRLGYSGEMMAHLMGYTKDHIYKVESGKLPVADSFDRAVRFAYINKTPDRYYDLHDLLLNGSGIIHINSMRFRLKDGNWLKDPSKDTECA